MVRITQHLLDDALVPMSHHHTHMSHHHTHMVRITQHLLDDALVPGVYIYHTCVPIHAYTYTYIATHIVAQ